MSSKFEDAAERKKRLERQLRIARSKERARDYEQKSEWADALRHYTDVLKDDPEDQEARAGVRRAREGLLIKLYATGMEQLDAGEWAAAVATFDHLLDEAKQAGLPDYQDARARRQEAQDHITPPKPPQRIPAWAIAGAGIIGGGVIVAALIAVSILVLRSCIPPTATPVSPTTVVIATRPPTETPTPQPSPATPISITPTQTLTASLSPTSGLTETPIKATDTPTPVLPLDTPIPLPSLSGKIAVPIFDTKAGEYNVYIARAEDNWQPKLFFLNGSQPTFSHDGRGIILRSWRSAAEGFGQRLILFPSLRTDVGNERLMTQSLEDAHPSLSRQGEIVFHTRREGAPILVTLGTWIGAESSIDNQHKLGPGENPDWLGDRIVYYSPGPPPGLYVTNADGSSVQQVLGEPGPLAPAAAPDGDHVAVSLKRDGYWHAFVFSVGQGQSSLTQLTRESADDLLPVWSPDGRSIAFVSNRGGKWAVWVMNSDGASQHKLFDMNGSIDGKVSIAPDKSFGWGEEKLSWAP